MYRFARGLVLAAALGIGGEAAAQPMPFQLPEQGWTFTVTPYFWAAGVNGTVTTPFERVPQRSVSADFDEIFPDISGFVFMGSAEARKDRVALVGDLVTLKLDAGFSTPQNLLFPGGEGELGITFAGLAAMYRVVQAPRYVLDVGAGLRVSWIDATLSLNSGLLPGRSVGDSANWVDPLGAARAMIRLSEQFSLSAYGDVGGWSGGSNLTWQAIGTLDWQPAPWVALRAGWRYFVVDRSANDLSVDLALSGPLIGATFRF